MNEKLSINTQRKLDTHHMNHIEFNNEESAQVVIRIYENLIKKIECKNI